MDLETLLKKHLKAKEISKKDKVLVVCGSNYDDQIINKLGFKNYLITSAYKNIDDVKYYKQADAQNLPFKDSSFDTVVVNLGLHHCASPHQALCEMYRVAKKAVIVHEAQDSWLVRFLVWTGFILEYETFDDIKSGNQKYIKYVNYVYRWTRREVKKTLNSYDPTRKHNINFSSSHVIHPNFFGSGGFWEKKSITKLLGNKNTFRLFNWVSLFLNSFCKNLGNDFTFIILKNKPLYHKWMMNDNEIETYFKNKFKQTIINKTIV